MIGVLVNTAAVILGGVIGLLSKKGIPKKITDAVMTAIGLCTIYIGIANLFKGGNPLILIAAAILGVALGTLLDIDGGINRLGEFVQSRFKGASGDGSRIAEGFVTASLLFCIGSMTVVGAISAGVSGDNGMLFTKSFLDFVCAVMFAASLGAGVLFSGAFVLVFEGALVLLAMGFGSFLSDEMIAEMTCAGGLAILAIGLNLAGIAKIKAANFLPALVFAPALTYLVSLF